MDQQVLQFFLQLAPMLEQYKQAVEEERKWQQAKMRKEQLEQQLLGFKGQISNLAQQINQQVFNPNNWPICPTTGQPYDPTTRENTNSNS